MVESAGDLTFEVVDRIRTTECPRASFHATLIAVAARASVPAVTLNVGWGLKRGEQNLKRDGGLFPQLHAQPMIRVLASGSNEPARLAGLRVFRNMRVPESSIITRLFRDPGSDRAGMTVRGVESLGAWTTSRLRLGGMGSKPSSSSPPADAGRCTRLGRAEREHRRCSVSCRHSRSTPTSYDETLPAAEVLPMPRSSSVVRLPAGVAMRFDARLDVRSRESRDSHGSVTRCAARAVDTACRNQEQQTLLRHCAAIA
jgi:hypothetical protein